MLSITIFGHVIVLHCQFKKCLHISHGNSKWGRGFGQNSTVRTWNSIKYRSFCLNFQYSAQGYCTTSHRSALAVVVYCHIIQQPEWANSAFRGVCSFRSRWDEWIYNKCFLYQISSLPGAAQGCPQIRSLTLRTPSELNGLTSEKERVPPHLKVSNSIKFLFVAYYWKTYNITFSDQYKIFMNVKIVLLFLLKIKWI